MTGEHLSASPRPRRDLKGKYSIAKEAKISKVISIIFLLPLYSYCHCSVYLSIMDAYKLLLMVKC